MPEQTTKTEPAPKKSEPTKEQKPKDLSAEKEKLTGDMDALIDEIDQALDATLGEQTAEQFCKAYIQRGGQ